MNHPLNRLRQQFYDEYDLIKHLSELLHTIVIEQPPDPVGSIEQISQILWSHRHVQDLQPSKSVDPSEIKRCTAIPELLDKLQSPARTKVDSTFFDLKSKWNNFGIPFSDDDLLLFNCSLIKLAERPDIVSLRLWGVFNTPNGPIFIAESDCLFESRADHYRTVAPYAIPPELGVGANRFVYYYSFGAFDEWIRLPDLRPSDISTSRKVIWNLTGDLSAAVRSYIPFDVTESIYVRTLISQISSDSIVAPNGYIIEDTAEEEEDKKDAPPDEEEDTKNQPPKPLKLKVDKNYEPAEVDQIEWVHVRPAILTQGRETYVKPPKPLKPPKKKKVKEQIEKDEPPQKPPPKRKEENDQSDTGNAEEEDSTQAYSEEPYSSPPEEEDKHEEEEQTPEEEVAAEEGLELFRGIDTDPGFTEEQSCWRTKVVNSSIQNDSYTYAENLRWPGSYTLSDGRSTCSFYCGTGKQYIVDGFQPPNPPSLAVEYRLKMIEKIDATLDEENELIKSKNPHKEEEEEEEVNE
jgi:hypothetical protein